MHISSLFCWDPDTEQCLQVALGDRTLQWDSSIRLLTYFEEQRIYFLQGRGNGTLMIYRRWWHHDYKHFHCWQYNIKWNWREIGYMWHFVVEMTAIICNIKVIQLLSLAPENKQRRYKKLKPMSYN